MTESDNDLQLREFRTVVFQDGNHYTALCREVDLAGFGKTPEEALMNLRAGLSSIVMQFREAVPLPCAVH